jgi:hypothetical protein
MMREGHVQKRWGYGESRDDESRFDDTVKGI